MNDRCIRDDCLDKEEALRRLVKAARAALPLRNQFHLRDLQAAIDFARPLDGRGPVLAESSAHELWPPSWWPATKRIFALLDQNGRLQGICFDRTLQDAINQVADARPILLDKGCAVRPARLVWETEAPASTEERL